MVKTSLFICGAVVVGGFYFGTKAQAKNDFKIQSATTNLVTQSSKSFAKKIKIYITGEVNSPGVIQTDTDARVADAIQVAGGLTSQADISLCNLAGFVSDGIAIHIPKSGEQSLTCGSLAVGQGSSSQGAKGVSGVKDLGGKININTATQAEIETLPGVGPTLGASIIKYREERGIFKNVSELQNVNGIGEKRYADLKDLITT